MHASCCHAYRQTPVEPGAASRAAERAARPERSERRRCHDDGSAEPARHAGRTHPLVAAMSEALRSLMPAGQPAQDSRELQDSARAFAHELADALRGPGGRGHGMHTARRGYDDLAQRVDRLAGEVARRAPASTNANSTTLSASLTMASLNLGVDDGGSSTSLSMTTIELEISRQSTGGRAAAAASPLLAAFGRLMSALQPDASAATDAGATDQLSSVLRELASALHRGPAASPSPAGTLLSLAA